MLKAWPPALLAALLTPYSPSSSPPSLCPAPSFSSQPLPILLTVPTAHRGQQPPLCKCCASKWCSGLLDRDWQRELRGRSLEGAFSAQDTAVAELRRVGVDAGALRRGGYEAAELRAGGFTEAELVMAGF
jgi:hypothetical protein